MKHPNIYQSRLLHSNAFRSFVVILSLLMTHFMAHAAFAEEQSFELDQSMGFEQLQDPAEVFFKSEEFKRILDRQGKAFDKSLDEVFTLEHSVPVGSNQWIRVRETFTLRSWLRFPHRAILFMGPMPLRGEVYSVPVEGYNATEMMAKRGFFAFTVDYLGVGDSTRPENGFDVTFDDSVDHMKRVLRYIRIIRLVRKVDLLGEGRGGVIATQLAADDRRVRSCIMNAMQYKTPTDVQLPMPMIFPNGYAKFPPKVYDSFLDRSLPEVKEFVVSQNSILPLGPLQAAAQGLPFYDPGVARVPGLVIHGSDDFLATANDPYDLVEDYGENGAQLEIFEDAGHYPRLDGPETAERFWQTLINFVDPE